ncbi:Protein mlp1 [Stygiomarasmius scandens]|uniref:Protein mlp1 n=1 Tax=Marasmiellus scandens TaxID=2682957 RepID=A0ABR1ITC9_9AGAR
MNNHELDDLPSRNQALLDQFTRVDIDHRRAIEELLAANGHAEQLRKECVNLRVVKKIWESIQTRLNVQVSKKNSLLLSKRWQR